MKNASELVTPVAAEYRRRRRRALAALGISVWLAGIAVYWGIIAEVPVDYRSDVDHFKYGSIGADSEAGIPYWIWRVLPEIFLEHLPPTAASREFAALPVSQRDGLQAYARSFGFVLESGRDTPIGFSKRRDIVTRVGLNCAVCHVGTVQVSGGLDAAAISEGAPAWTRTPLTGATRRSSAEAPAVGSDAEAPEPRRAIVLGMPAHTVDLQGYFEFLFRCASDGHFTTANVMTQIDARTRLSLKDRLFYRFAIGSVREMLLTRQGQLAYLREPRVPPFGPGRVDTFTPYKTIQFGFPWDGTIGTSYFPSLWNQRPREGMHLHRDGNNQSVFERNISASLGAGATPVSLDLHRMLRVARWIGSPEPDPDKEYTRELRNQAVRTPVPAPDELPVPRFPFPVNRDLAMGLGQSLFRNHCATCHDWSGRSIGEIVPISEILTDRHRLDSYTWELSVNQNTFGVGHWWRFRNFRKTTGYANAPLDGIWARSPYLHNGSVPTLRDLLNRAADRPQKFTRGDDAYDPVRVGLRHDTERQTCTDGRPLFLFDTTLPGNSNSGHEYGCDLTESEKMALVEYLKTL